MKWLSTQFYPIIIHPLITNTICLMLGIWFASPLSNYSLIIFIGGACALYHLITATTRLRLALNIFYLFGAFSIGFLLATMQRSQHTTTAQELGQGPYDFIATVTSLQSSDKKQHPHTIQLHIHKRKSARYNAAWHEQPLTIAAFCHSVPFLEPGDLVYLERCKLSKHAIDSDFNNYLIKNGINATLFCHHLDYTLLHRPSFSLERSIAFHKQRLFQNICAKMSESTAAFYSSLFLGNCQTHKQYLKEVKMQFGIWGLSHFLARSGLHLVLFIYIWHLLFAYIPIRSRYKYIFMLLLNGIYLLFSWSSLSFMRSFTSLCLYYLAHIMQQQSSTLHIITLVTCGCLLINPMQLFALDFQLSFGLTFALAWIYQTYSWHRLHIASNS